MRRWVTVSLLSSLHSWSSTHSSNLMAPSLFSVLSLQNYSLYDLLSFLSKTLYPFEIRVPELHPASKVCVHKKWWNICHHLHFVLCSSTSNSIIWFWATAEHKVPFCRKLPPKLCVSRQFLSIADLQNCHFCIHGQLNSTPVFITCHSVLWCALAVFLSMPP